MPGSTLSLIFDNSVMCVSENEADGMLALL